MAGMYLHQLVTTSHAVGSTRSRTRKVALLSDYICGLDDDDLPLGVAYLAGAVRQGRIGIGYAAVAQVDVPAADEPTLRLTDVDARLDTLAGTTGPGSRQLRRTVLHDLFGQATDDEQQFLRRLLLGEMRHGALDGVMVAAIAKAGDVPDAAVRRAYMLSDDLAAVATAALHGGKDALDAFRLRVGQPVQPMLASTAADTEAALAGAGPVVIDAKIDGARVQVHRRGQTVGVYTRSLRDITAEVPDIVALVRGLPTDGVILDGEAVSLRADGRPEPFQVTMQRLGDEVRASAPASAGAPADGDLVDRRIPMAVRFFDCLYRDGVDLIDEPLRRRIEELDAVVDSAHVVERILTNDPQDAAGFFDKMVAAGYEGVVVKMLDAPYEAGRRGAAWRKVKPSHTLDLVVLAVEWGSGRRKGWLSNLHLGARDPEGGFVMLGKTFKGLTDELLEWQTARFLELEMHRRGHVVYVEPVQVVEIAFDGVQTSTRYPGGVALRFARVKRYRDDKTAAQADTIDQVRAIHAGA
jgi:DNA ligase-1